MNILFSDQWLVICEKPVGVSSEEGMTGLLAQNGIPGCFCVHRLDQTVGGVTLYARDGKTAAKLSQMFAAHEITKRYLAVVSGTPDPKQGTMEDLLFHDRTKNKTYVVGRMRSGVKDAKLDYHTISIKCKEKSMLSLVEVQLHTGRSHQIRVQFASRKMPICGDVKYGSTVKDCSIALRCIGLSFSHPETGEQMRFELQPQEVYPWNYFSETFATESI